MINWFESMEQTFEYYEVDPITWKDVKQITNITSSSISRDDGTDTLGSASIEMENMVGECYIRIYMIARQKGITHKEPLGTFLIQTPSSSFDGKTRKVSIDAYTPLLELKENPTPLGYALLKNDNIMKEAYLLVKDNCRVPVIETESNKQLTANFVADSGDSWLTFIRDLILQAKYSFGLDEMGQIIFRPNQKTEELQPKWTFNDDNSSILLPELTLKHDLYKVPNVVEVVCSTGTTIVTSRVENDDPNSPTSTVKRGREILYRDTKPDIHGYPTQEQLDEYAENLLSNLSSVEYTVSYSHAYCPVTIGDCVRLNYEKADLKNVKAKIISQSISCKPGCTVKETAVFTKKLWK